MIFKHLDIPVSTAGSSVRKWELQHTTQAVLQNNFKERGSLYDGNLRQTNNHFEEATEFSG